MLASWQLKFPATIHIEERNSGNGRSLSFTIVNAITIHFIQFHQRTCRKHDNATILASKSAIETSEKNQCIFTHDS